MWQADATTNAIVELAGYLVAERIPEGHARVDYWRIWYYLLEAAGLDVQLVRALTGRFDAHQGELARMLLDQIDALTAQITRLTIRIEELIAAIPEAQGVDPDATTGPLADRVPGSPVLPASTGSMRSPASAARPPA